MSVRVRIVLEVVVRRCAVANNVALDLYELSPDQFAWLPRWGSGPLIERRQSHAAGTTR
jgi:hypothetical protein